MTSTPQGGDKMATEIEKIHYDNHYMVTTSEQIKAIAAPLRRLGVLQFDHFRIYEDNSAIDLTTTPEFCEFYGKNKLYLKGCAGNFDDYHDGYFFWDTLTGAADVFKAIEQQSHMGHGVTIVKTYEHYCDHFYLAGDINNPGIKNFFINQKELIELFILYYYQQAKKIIDNARPHSYLFPQGKRECDEMLDPNFSFTNGDVLRLGALSSQLGNPGFTNRELQCVFLCAQGKSSKVIASALSISAKTVENHLANARKKSGANNTMALINMICGKSNNLFTD
ncbi:MAG: hypothetical protein CMF39_02880 [Legionellaceae bacterium]|nr:hypothetical protein [Legionellaceae bacterium]|tara:strand:- start:275 stop:1114 length:840 start_codon:yes stop_codon:yes gene_type:complete